MNTKKSKLLIPRSLIVLLLLILTAALVSETDMKTNTGSAEITFMEFGSTTCIPCKMMEKVLVEIKDIYKEKIDIQFINVMKEQQEARDYGIQLIPTQIFFDNNGEEFFRHQGYFPTAEIQKIIDEQLKKQQNTN